MGSIKIGTCGYGYYQPPGNWKERYDSKLQAYSHAFAAGEINRTFYKLPMVRTTERWRREATGAFEFTLKAWQAITHPVSSPTWRKRKEQLTEEQKKGIGYFNPSDVVFEAWEETRKRAEALNAGVCVFQTPAGFDCSDEHMENIRRFMDGIDRGSLALAWEPRGNWNENLNVVQSICDELDLIHVTDIMRRKPVSDHWIAYIRLHGLNEREYDYNYEYSEEELREIAARIDRLSNDHDTVYCMLNNFAMFENANRLEAILGERD